MVKASVLVALLGCLGLFMTAGAARADVAGPRDVCEFDEKTCTTCWEPYGKPPEGDAAFKTCQEGAVAKGYKESCRNRQGAGDNVVFCAEPTSAQKVTKGGGCGGCSLGEGAATNALLGASAVALLFAARRRRPGKKQ